MSHQSRGDAIREEVAFDCGRAFAKEHKLAETTTQAMTEYCARWAGSLQFYDVFKYAAQAVWRERGEL